MPLTGHAGCEQDGLPHGACCKELCASKCRDGDPTQGMHAVLEQLVS